MIAGNYRGLFTRLLLLAVIFLTISCMPKEKDKSPKKEATSKPLPYPLDNICELLQYDPKDKLVLLLSKQTFTQDDLVIQGVAFYNLKFNDGGFEIMFPNPKKSNEGYENGEDHIVIVFNVNNYAMCAKFVKQFTDREMFTKKNEKQTGMIKISNDCFLYIEGCIEGDTDFYIFIHNNESAKKNSSLDSKK